MFLFFKILFWDFDGPFVYAAAQTKKIQVEEGFRWRENFGEPFQGIHEDMARYEKFLSPLLNKKAKAEERAGSQWHSSFLFKNIALAKIGIKYLNDQNEEKYVWRWIYSAEGAADKICTFVSGSKATLDEYLDALIGNPPRAFYEVMGSTRSLTDISTKKYENILSLLNKYKQIAKHSMSVDDSALLKRENELKGDSKYHDRDYGHSEQWLLQYVNNHFTRLLDSLWDEIVRPAGTLPKKVTQFILCIHSKKDVCERCTQTISASIPILQDSFNRWLAKKIPFIPALVLVSSREINRGRRFEAGHGDKYSKGIDQQDVGIFHYQTALEGEKPLMISSRH